MSKQKAAELKAKKIQTRHIETVGPGTHRPIYRVLAPAEWGDEQIKDAFRTAAHRWVGYLFPRERAPKRSLSYAVWVGLDNDQIREALDLGEGRHLDEEEVARLAALHPGLAAELRTPAPRPGCSTCQSPATVHDYNALGEYGAYYCADHEDEADVRAEPVPEYGAT